MTSNEPAGDRPAELLLGKAHKHYAELSAHLLKVTDALDNGEKLDAKQIGTLVRSHWAAFQSVFKLEMDLDERRRERAGIVHGYALDLESAADEVGRRLACLRDASRSGNVSGGPE